MGFARRAIGLLTRTKPALEPADTDRASRMLMVDGVCSTSMATLQGGPFLAAFAIALGASNYQIGLLATVTLASQFMQVPGLSLLQRWPRRRAIVVLAAGASRLLWLGVILTPFLFGRGGVMFLMAILALISVTGAVAGPPWNSLIRDIVPKDRMGRVFSRRMVLGTAFALGLTLGGGYFIDLWGRWRADVDAPLYGYTLLFAAGMGFGFLGLLAVARLPEPRMPHEPGRSVWALLARPTRDPNFRRLLWFIGSWSFAMNLAGPFFIVYLLNRIGLRMSTVTVLVVISQITNMIFLRIWGRLADRFSNKSVLVVAGPLFLLAVLAWTFTTLPETHVLTFPLLVVIHVFSGMSLAGVSLASANIALKLSPEGQAHTYMTAYGLAGSLAGAVAPLLGGLFADFFGPRQLSVSLTWFEPARRYSIEGFHLKALDFLFAMAFVGGLVSLRLLRRVRESGEVDEKVVRTELLSETFATMRTISTMPGVRHLITGPVSTIYRLAKPVVTPPRNGGPTANPPADGNGPP